MERLDIQRLMELQDELQAKYAGKWPPIGPEEARNHLLWMLEEMGEVAAIFKKRTEDGILNDPTVRSHFIEEMSDVLMYFLDVLQCCGVTAEEFTTGYLNKHNRNMKRDFIGEHKQFLRDEEEGHG